MGASPGRHLNIINVLKILVQGNNAVEIRTLNTSQLFCGPFLCILICPKYLRILHAVVAVSSLEIFRKKVLYTVQVPESENDLMKAILLDSLGQGGIKTDETLSSGLQ